MPVETHLSEGIGVTSLPWDLRFDEVRKLRK
jgi:hypothetical protein